MSRGWLGKLKHGNYTPVRSVNYCDGLGRCFHFVCIYACTAVFLCCYLFSANKDLYSDVMTCRGGRIAAGCGTSIARTVSYSVVQLAARWPQRIGGTANVHVAATTARPECSCPTGVRLESLRPCHADPDPAALAAGQLQNKVQAVLPRPRHPRRSQPGVSDGNSPVSRVAVTLVAGYAHLPHHRWTTLYHGCARSSASGRSHMRVDLPPGTLCPTTSAPWLILSSSENC